MHKYIEDILFSFEFLSFIKILYRLKSEILSFPLNIASKISLCYCIYMQLLLFYYFEILEVNVLLLFVTIPSFIHSLLLSLSVASSIV